MPAAQEPGTDDRRARQTKDERDDVMAVEAQNLETVAPGVTTEADEFASVLRQSFKPRTERARVEVDNAISTLVEQALTDSSVVKNDVLDTIEEMIARIDKKLTAQMNEILHAPEFQQIESAWRGLHYLVYNSETDAELKIKVLNVSKKEISRNLQEQLSRARNGTRARCSRPSTSRNTAFSAASPTAA